MLSKPPSEQRRALNENNPSAEMKETELLRGWLANARLMDSVRQLIRLRWFAGLGVVAAAVGIGFVFKIANNTIHLISVGVLILLYNAVFYILNLRYRSQDVATELYMPLATSQMVLDWLAMILLIHYSGGIESPAIYFFLFHIVIASIFLQALRFFWCS